jgi:hypothetical protein
MSLSPELDREMRKNERRWFIRWWRKQWSPANIKKILSERHIDTAKKSDKKNAINQRGP